MLDIVCDEFGRVIEMTTEHDLCGGSVNTISDLHYAYDSVGRVPWEDRRHESLGDVYWYDGPNRLVAMTRGTANVAAELATPQSTTHEQELEQADECPDEACESHARASSSGPFDLGWATHGSQRHGAHYPMNRTALAIALTISAGAAGCHLPPNQKWKPTLRVGAVVADSYDATVSAPGVLAVGETEYESVDVGLGATRVEDSGGGQQKPLEMAEVVVGFSSFGDVDAIEVSGGGRWYFAQAESFAPFVSVHAVNTIFEDVAGTSVGVQLGLRVGGGVAWWFHSQAFADFGVDYNIPLLAAESDTNPFVETEVDGLAVRIGFGVSF